MPNDVIPNSAMDHSRRTASEVIERSAMTNRPACGLRGQPGSSNTVRVSQQTQPHVVHALGV